MSSQTFRRIGLLLLAGFPIDPGRAQASETIATPACTVNNIRAINLSLPSMLRSVLAKDPKQGLEAARFIDTRPRLRMEICVNFTQMDSFPGLCARYDDEESWASYETASDLIRIEHNLVHQEGGDEAALIQDPRRLSRFIAQLAPIAVHEVSHVRDFEATRSRLPHLEAELTAYYREAFYILDTLSASPDRDAIMRIPRRQADGDALRRKVAAISKSREGASRRFVDEVIGYNKEMRALSELLSLVSTELKGFASGNVAFEKSIRRRYPQDISVFDDDCEAKMRANGISRLKQAQELLRKISLDCPAGITSASATCSSSMLYLRERTVGVIEHNQAQLKELDDASALPRSREHYKVILGELRSEADRRRIEQRELLKPFMPPERVLKKGG